SILAYWTEHTQDETNGGFYGSINWENEPDPQAAKGLVMYSRICWAFSAAYDLTRQQEYLALAGRAFAYLVDHFVDPDYGGVYWSVDAKGNRLDAKKQIYGQAFCIYALAEYYKVSSNESALHLAKDLFDYIEKYSFDQQQGGYIEALTREWNEASDLRLSEKDDNERKTTNTHLHIVEAYACLYQVWPSERLREKILHVLKLFSEHIISREHDHLLLFFDDNWQSRSTLISFGHDIEAAWLLAQCAAITEDADMIRLYQPVGTSLVDAAKEGLDKNDGGLWYEYEFPNGKWIYEKHSWPQAEAMIGFFYAWQTGGDEMDLQHSINAWSFVKKYIHDKQNGEWFWGVNQDYSIMKKEKAGFWKCPYHNSRACIELIRRISGIIPSKL
ncbi:MAG: N-acyl-D-glucosamine 2-epimerase, partial [Chitinophagaceae bacterium]